MKRIIVSICFVIIVPAFALGQIPAKSTKFAKAGQASKASSNNAIEQEILKLMNDLRQARVANDRATYSRLISDDSYLITSAGGTREGGNQITGNINTIANSGPLLSYELYEVRIKAYGSNTAVATARRILKSKNEDGSPKDIPQRVLQVWVKQKGRWQIVASSITPILAAQ
jgi:ketosteroid isomerase-like protein